MARHIRDISRDWRAGDAERLARFFNKQGHGWPGGGWDPQTPEEAERRLREHEQLGVFVTEEGSEFRSFCSLHAKPNETNGAYVGLLTADPDYHGRGYGKAVLHQAIERVYQQGIPRVDLHTWAGNMKAVPLYKKSGFMWTPEGNQWGGVFMQNFTPGARRYPVAQEYFRKHDWYATLKRDLSLVPDEHKRGKVKAYEYIWEEDGDRLRMVFDRQSWGLVEVEINDFVVGCSLADEKLVAGVPQRIIWNIVNRNREPLDVVLIANGDEGIQLDFRELLKVNRRAQLEAEFVIDPEIRDKEKEPRSPVILTDVLVNGRPIRLEAGFEAKQAVGFNLDGDGQGLRPGRLEPVVVQCRNELDSPARVKLHIAASPGVDLDARTTTVRIPAKGSAEVPVQVTAREAGPITLNVRSEVTAGKQTVRPKPAELHAHVLAAGDVVGHVEKDRVVLESAAIRVNIGRRGGWISVMDKLRNRGGGDVGGIGRPMVGPPFVGDEFFDTPCEALVEQEGGRVTAALRSASIYRPGVVLEERVTISNLPLVEVKCAVTNNSSSRLVASIRQGAWFQNNAGKMSALVDGEIVEGTTGPSRSLIEHRLSDKEQDWAEGWFATENPQGLTAAVLWDKAELSDRGEITRKLADAAPGESVSAPSLYVFVGEGGTFAVRRWWQTLFGERTDREVHTLEKRRPLEFGLRPRPLIIHGRETKAALLVDPVGKLDLDGIVEVKLPKGLRTTSGRFEFKGANQSRKIERKVSLTRSASTPEGGYFAESSLRLDRAIYRERQPVIVLGDPRKQVTVNRLEDDGRLEIGNGVLTMTVAPRFMGSAISLRRRGEELLRSSYPETRPLAFMNPWAGGIQPGLGGLTSGELLRQKFVSREITRRGAQGIVWQGVRVSCSPKEGQRREDTLAIDYLLAPGSSIFAVCIRIAHRADVAGWVDASFQLYPIVGGSYLDALVRGSSDERASRIRGDNGGFVPNNRWVIAENPKAREAVVLACCDKEAVVGASIWGRDGYCLDAWRGATHEARQSRESIFFAAWIEAERARDLGQSLSELKGLP